MQTAIVSWASADGRLKIISGGAISNGGGRRNIHYSSLLNRCPATLWGLISYAAGNPGLYLCVYAYSALEDKI